MIKTLQQIWAEDWIAVEMARRKVAFHDSEQPDEISLWGLFEYDDIKEHLASGKLINHLNYTPKNRVYWVIPSKEYWENIIKPIVEQFTLAELQKSFGWNSGE